ncbi:hypothetical protein LLG46_01975 [bacterium]|nr:hypothetical protein [bacterium]
MSFLDRVKKKLAKYGESFTVTGGTYQGIFRMLSSSTMNTYLDDIEVLGVGHPGLLLITQGDADINVDDTLTRDGRSYTVARISQHRIGDVCVVKLAILVHWGE